MPTAKAVLVCILIMQELTILSPYVLQRELQKGNPGRRSHILELKKIVVQTLITLTSPQIALRNTMQQALNRPAGQ